VLVVDGAHEGTGGADFGGGTSTYSTARGGDVAELYDSNSAIWAATPNLSDLRELQVAVLLTDGRVVIAGGSTAGSASDSAELYGLP
jgi:hypothetical protein